MRYKFLSQIVIGLLGLSFASLAPAQERTDEVANWDFDVYLDDKKIGKHFFTVTEADGVKHVQSEANFKVKIAIKVLSIL